MNLIQKCSFCLVVIFAALLAGPRLVVAAPQKHGIHPPFKKLWTSPGLNSVFSDYVLADGTIYFATSNTDYGAKSLATGKVLWRKQISKKGSLTEIAYGDGILFVSTSDICLLACAAKTGKTLWSLPTKDYPHPMIAGDGVLYCETREGSFSALDMHTGKLRWTISVIPAGLATAQAKKIHITTAPVLMGDQVIVVTVTHGYDPPFFGELLSLDRRTGAVRWRTRVVSNAEEWVGFITHDAERVIYTLGFAATVAVDRKTGHTVWRYPAGYSAAILDNEICIADRNYGVHGLDLRTGKELWQTTLPHKPAMEPEETAIQVFENQILASNTSTLYAFDGHGRALWHWDREEALRDWTPLPDGGLLIEGTTRFVQGKPDTLPATASDSANLARRLVARLDKLDSDEQRTLVKLGDPAFDALYPVVMARLDAYERSVANAQAKGSQGDFELHSSYADAIKLLRQIATKRHTDRLIELLSHAHVVDTQSDILGALKDVGDPEKTTPIFLNILRTQHTDWSYGFHPMWIALEAVSHSSHPRAISYLIDEVGDPKADPFIRHSAYVNLARTGGDAGVRAVLAARDTRRSIPPLSDFMGLDKLGMAVVKDEKSWTPLVATDKDERGTLWGLVSSGALGDHRDLWLVKSDGGHWTNPIYTGLKGDKSAWKDSWLKTASDAALSRDSDGDGWTDLVEAHLGTDPAKPDTDGDGLPDSQDKNPLTAPRTLSEEEQVLAAAFEGHYRFLGGRSVPCLVTLPKDIKPLELAGWDWVIITEESGTKSALGKMVQIQGRGLASVSFDPSALDFDNTPRENAKDRDGAWILWNKDHTAAKMMIRTYYGGLDATGDDITLKKLDGQWVVTEEREIWVS